MAGNLDKTGRICGLLGLQRTSANGKAPDMSSARLTRILRSASFRLTLFYAVLFVASAGALFATVYWTATAAMQNDMAAVLRTEAYQLAEVHGRTGLAGLAQQITRRM